MIRHWQLARGPVPWRSNADRRRSAWSRLKRWVRGAKHRPLGECDALATRLLVDLHAVLAAAGVSFALDYGTLLGIHREQRLLPWDHDLDACVMSTDAEALLGTAPDLKQLGWHMKLPDRMVRDGEGWRRGDLARVRVVSRGGLLRTSGVVALDLFVKYEVGEQVTWVLPARDMAFACRVPRRFYEHMGTLCFAGRRFRAPSPVAQYLARLYADPQTPCREHHPLRDDLSIVGRAW